MSLNDLVNMIYTDNAELTVYVFGSEDGRDEFREHDAFDCLLFSVRSPCKIGDTLYMIVKKPIPEKGLLGYVRRFSLTYKNLAWVLRCLGRRVFPSSEEAEAAISDMERKSGKK